MAVEGAFDWTPPPTPPAAPVTADELLAFMGAPVTPENSAWSGDCIAAVWASVTTILDRADAVSSPSLAAELRVATMYAAATAYKRREALFGTAAYVDPTSGAVVRVPADYAETVRGILDRYARVGFA